MEGGRWEDGRVGCKSGEERDPDEVHYSTCTKVQVHYFRTTVKRSSPIYPGEPGHSPRVFGWVGRGQK